MRAARNGKIIDDNGKIHEDFHGTQAFGHRHPDVTKAIQNYLETDFPSWFPSRVSPFSGRLAKLLCQRGDELDYLASLD